MQVFAPYPSLETSVRCLDPSRLGNQIYREAKTLISGGWPHHPASKMWWGCEASLALYCLYGLQELQSRGHQYDRWVLYYTSILNDQGFAVGDHPPLPSWFGDDRVHSSHRSALLRKGIEDTTFQRSRNLPGFPKLRKYWDNDTYQRAWEMCGKPNIQDTWYGRFGWTDDPDVQYFWPL